MCFKKILKYILISAATISVISVAVSAKNVNLFSDVKQDKWYYQNIEQSKKYGIITGYSDSTFRPEKNISHIEALVMATSATMTISENSSDTDSFWGERYVKSAEKAGINLLNFESYKNNNITRYEFMKYCYELLKYKYQLNNNRISNNIFNDFNDSITTFMYNEGLINGTVTNGSRMLNPNSYITRAEAVTITNRVIEYCFEKNMETDEIVLVNEPSTEKEIIDVYLYMAFNNLSTIDIKYSIEADYVELSNMYQEYFNPARELYYQYFQTFGDCSIRVLSDGEKYTFRISLDKMNNHLSESERFFNNCNSLNDKLWASGVLNAKMTQYEMAEEIFRYVCLNFSYDLKDPADVLYNQGNIMLDNKSGICSGYVSVYNTLCNLNGIYAVGINDIVNGDLHMYSYLFLDENGYYADATFGDPITTIKDYVDMDWFGLTEQEIMAMGRETVNPLFKK